MSARVPLAVALVVASAAVASAANPALSDDQLKFFESKIRPVLLEKCYSCHSADTPKGPKGGLALDTRDGLLKGGDGGPAVVPGSPKKSLLVKALNGDDKTSQMPPKGKLPADTIADFEKWVAMGLPDPRTGKTAAKGNTVTAADVTKGKEFWSFKPVAKVTPPKADAWATTDVDRFVLAAMTEKKLTPVADADKRTLLRRVHFDLTGLPPTPDELAAFLNDKSADAFEKVVDRLLASPQFGEKWGRHWLDVARYAESSGKEQNIAYPYAWRYRDYVIQSFNADKPVNEFFKEQVAGDLMGGKDDTQKAERTIATGYLAVGAKSLTERNPRQFQLDVADEQIDAVTQGMLGLTVACARCHDHKFDPIPTKDYYALAGIFTSTDTRTGSGVIQNARNGTPALPLPAGANVPLGPTLSKAEVTADRDRLDALRKQRDEALEEARKTKEPPLRLVALGVQISTLQTVVDRYDADGAPKKLAMGAADRFAPRDMPVHLRGEVDKLGDVVPRGFVQVVSTKANPTVRRNESGRLELADWISSADNPLTARVYVNRIWGHLFGKGLVATPDNFGATGRAPTHPEMLDFLAGKFTASGDGGMKWSTKSLVRTLVLSHTYRLSSDHQKADFATDPDDIYLWRMPKRRLDAESIRDAMLEVSGELDTKPADGSPVGKLAGNVQGRPRLLGMGMGGGGDLYETSKRSVYIPVVRDNVPESLELFDFAEPSLVSGARDDTSVPAQALYLLNNEHVMKMADATADRITKKATGESERIDAAFRLVLQRPATAKEAAAASAFLTKFKQAERKADAKPAAPVGPGRFGGGAFRRPAPPADSGDKAAWAALVQALFGTAEFRYVD